MRVPFQVLVFLFRESNSGYEYLLLHREDLECWQGVAGGVNQGETPSEAALRESEEETGICSTQLIKLESFTTIPAPLVSGFLWGEKILVVGEHSFGIEAPQSFRVVLSSEHTGFRWCQYEEARSLLKWDSNRNALWELNYRLTKT